MGLARNYRSFFFTLRDPFFSFKNNINYFYVGCGENSDRINSLTNQLIFDKKYKTTKFLFIHLFFPFSSCAGNDMRYDTRREDHHNKVIVNV